MNTKNSFLSVLSSIFLTALIYFHPVEVHSEDKSFVVVIASYNNKNCLQKNLDSVFNQKYPLYRAIYIDDASTDKTGDYVEEYIRTHHLEDRLTLIRNEKNIGALANKYKAVHLCQPHEIVVDLDGDDWFVNEEVFAHLNTVYADPNVWLTYGQFIRHPWNTIGFGREVPHYVINYNSFRDSSVGTTPLRTFYAALFHQIKQEDFLYNGEFFTSASDLAFMFPMLEMAGEHIKFVPNLFYVYNNSTPLNDHKVRPKHQEDMDRYIRKKNRYTRLQSINNERPSI